MKKSDLKTGMVVETRDGWRGIVLRDVIVDDYGTERDFIIGLKEPTSNYEPFSDYDDDLLLKYRGLNDNFLDIMYVYKPAYITDIFKCAEGEIDKFAMCIYNRYEEENKWCDDWRNELQNTNYGCYERLCECRNTINDVILMARLMWKYNPSMSKSDCLDRMIEWCGNWNNQFELMDKMCTEYKKYLKKI